MKLSHVLALTLPVAQAKFTCYENSRPVDCPCNVEITYDKEWRESATNRFRSRIDFSGVDSNGQAIDPKWVKDNIGTIGGTADDSIQMAFPGLSKQKLTVNYLGCHTRLNTQQWQTTDKAYNEGQWLIDWGYTFGTGDYGACRSGIANEWARVMGCSTNG